MAKSTKGFAYEREICKLLSLWWTDGERDDIFWRSSGSGARATTRRKKGKTTANSSTDVVYLDRIGRPLTELLTIEIKRGYSGRAKKGKKTGYGASIHDILDMPKINKMRMYEEWFAKTIASAKATGTWAWVLITCRDYREPLIFIPWRWWHDLSQQGINRPYPFVCLDMKINKKTCIVGMRLSSFLKRVTKNTIKKYWKWFKEGSII